MTSRHSCSSNRSKIRKQCRGSLNWYRSFISRGDVRHLPLSLSPLRMQSTRFLRRERSLSSNHSSSKLSRSRVYSKTCSPQGSRRRILQLTRLINWLKLAFNSFGRIKTCRIKTPNAVCSTWLPNPRKTSLHKKTSNPSSNICLQLTQA